MVAPLRREQDQSAQDARTAPDIARDTVPGSENFCVLTDEPVEQIAQILRGLGIEIVDGPDERDGARELG